MIFKEENSINTNLLKNKFLLNSLIILTFIILSIFSALLLLNHHIVYVGWDTQFHFKRIMELKMLILHGDLLSNFSFNEFHGSIIMLLYPNINLIPAVLLSFIVKSSINLVYAIFIFNTFITLIISFYSCKNYVKSFSTSYLFSIIYGLSNTFLLYNLISSDFGIVYSYILLPLIIFGFLKVIQNKNEWIELSMGMSLLLYSHILNFLILSIFLVIFLLINTKKVNKNIILNFFKAILLFLILTSIILLPFLKFYVDKYNSFNMPVINQLSRVGIKEFFSGIYGNKSMNTINTFSIISIFIAPFFYKKMNRYIRQCYILSIAIIFSALFLPWSFITTHTIFRFLNYMQFTFRLLIIPQILLTFIFALIITKFIHSVNKKYITFLLTIFVSIILQITVGQYMMIQKFSKNPFTDNYLNNKNNYFNTSRLNGYQINSSHQFSLFLHNYSDSLNDYIPKSALSMSSYVNHDLGVYDKRYPIKVKHIGYNTFNFPGKNDINQLSLPIYAYNRENLYVYLNDKIVNNHINKNGLLTVDNIQHNIKPNNKIYLKSPHEPFRIIGAVLSIFGWLFVLGAIMKKFVRK